MSLFSNLSAEQKQKILNYLQIIALTIGFCWALLYPFLTPYPLVDLEILMKAGSGTDMSGFYYAPWILPFFTLLSQLPVSVAGALANLISMAGFLFAIYVFKGNRIHFFICYPLFYTIYYGQVDGIYAFGLAWMCLALQRRDPLQASLAWMIALSKWYIGGPLGLGLLWCYADNRLRTQVLGLIAVYLGLSLLVWQNWMIETAQRMMIRRPTDLYSIDSWDFAGAFALLLWVPVLLSRTRDYRWWVMTWALTTPYIHIHGMTHVLLFPVGIIGWLVNINYLTGLIVSRYMLLVPLYVYLVSWWRSWQTDRLSDGLRQWRGVLSKQPATVDPA